MVCDTICTFLITIMERKAKKELIEKFASSNKDTGSAMVQIAILTQRIFELAEHLKLHPKDNSSRRGLLGLVSKRRRLLSYLKKNKPEVYTDITSKLQLKAS